MRPTRTIRACGSSASATRAERADRSFFAQTTTRVGAGIEAALSRFVDVGADVDRMTIEIGTANREPSIEDVFAPTDAVAFGTETDFQVYGGFVRINLLDQYDFPPVGLDLTLEGWRYDDQDLDVLSFSKLVGQIRLQVPLGVRSRRFAVKLRTSHSMADAGSQVPFYLMETIGGSRTLRGFDEYRFRDTRNLVLNAEYRWEVWTYASFAFFYDAGKVFSDADDLNFDGMRSGYGFGLRVHAPGPVFFNVDLARGIEGYKLHIGGGPSF